MPVSAAAHSVAEGLARWEISGLFPHPHWLAHACSGLADLGISVTKGHAVRRDGAVWAGHLEADVSRASVSLDRIDVGLLASRRPRGRDDVPLRLSTAAAARRDDGFLVVDVSAPDELGFLSRLLRRVAALGLHPVEVIVATDRGVATDRLVLAGIGSTVPAEAISALLDEVLRRALAS